MIPIGKFNLQVKVINCCVKFICFEEKNFKGVINEDFLLLYRIYRSLCLQRLEYYGFLSKIWPALGFWNGSDTLGKRK